MSRALKKRSLWWAIGLIVAASVFADMWHTDRARVARTFLPTGVVAAPGAKSMVVIVGSDDADLTHPVPLMVRPEYANDPHADMEARMTPEQIEEMVYKALNMDTSERSIREVVQPGDWVVVKPNIVTCPDGANIANAYGQKSWSKNNNRNQDHWGQNTDLRVVRAVLKYLIEVDGDAGRITIAEGGAEWRKLGESGTNSNQGHDGWTAHWEPFSNLSYEDIVAGFQDNANGIPVDIVDLNYDNYVDKDGQAYPWTNHNPSGDPIPVPDPNGTGVTWFQRDEGFYVSETLLNCDKLINLPAMKTHDIPGVTTIHKQYVGTYMQYAYGSSSGKGGLHDDGVGKVPNGFMDLFSYCPTDYAVVEGFWGVEGQGPQTGDDVKLNVIVAGGDPVATESVVAEIMGFNPHDVYHLHLSAAKGFGTWDPQQIEIVGRTIEAVRRPFKKPSSLAAGPMGILRWLVNGPYEGSSIDVDYLGAEGTLTPVAGDVSNGQPWQEIACDLREQSTLALGATSNRTQYGFTWVKSDAQRTVNLKATGDDRIKVWLNGELVGSSSQINTSVTLNEGYNALSVKVTNAAGSSSMKVFLLDSDNNTPFGTQYVLRKEPDVAVEEEDPTALPSAFTLSQNTPNPFNPSTWIPFELSRSGPVHLAIYNLAGQKVRTLLDKELIAGIGYTTFWNGKDEEGREMASGVYVAEMTGDGGAFKETLKMTLVR
ncbi:MAG: DUF362 domain-containing protein [Candidatus Latescibacterota bacterium]